MAKPRRVTFRRTDIKSVVQQLDGQEKPYDVYRFSGRRRKFERPTLPGTTYRWLR